MSYEVFLPDYLSLIRIKITFLQGVGLEATYFSCFDVTFLEIAVVGTMNVLVGQLGLV